MNKILRHFIAGILCILFIPLAQAQSYINKLEELKSIPNAIVLIEADWCSTCKQQKKVLSELLKQNKYKILKLHYVNFDKQKELLKDFHVNMQSTLIAYKNGIEMNRITGETRSNELAKILDKAL